MHRNVLFPPSAGPARDARSNPASTDVFIVNLKLVQGIVRAAFFPDDDFALAYGENRILANRFPAPAGSSQASNELFVLTAGAAMLRQNGRELAALK